MLWSALAGMATAWFQAADSGKAGAPALGRLFWFRWELSKQASKLPAIRI